MTHHNVTAPLDSRIFVVVVWRTPCRSFFAAEKYRFQHLRLPPPPLELLPPVNGGNIFSSSVALILFSGFSSFPSLNLSGLLVI